MVRDIISEDFLYRRIDGRTFGAQRHMKYVHEGADRMGTRISFGDRIVASIPGRGGYVGAVYESSKDGDGWDLVWMGGEVLESGHAIKDAMEWCDSVDGI